MSLASLLKAFRTNMKVLYWCVKKCLEIGAERGDRGAYEAVGEKTKKALFRIASESKLNRKRVSTLYKIDVPEVAATEA